VAFIPHDDEPSVSIKVGDSWPADRGTSCSFGYTCTPGVCAIALDSALEHTQQMVRCGKLSSHCKIGQCIRPSVRPPQWSLKESGYATMH
jgi:hypothetical protein